MTNEKDSYFIGRTNVYYYVQTSEDGKSCTVTYSLFENDGFWDPDVVGETMGKILPIDGFKPDGKGPNLETKNGKPYQFIPQEVKIKFPNPKRE